MEAKHVCGNRWGGPHLFFFPGQKGDLTMLTRYWILPTLVYGPVDIPYVMH